VFSRVLVSALPALTTSLLLLLVIRIYVNSAGQPEPLLRGSRLVKTLHVDPAPTDRGLGMVFVPCPVRSGAGVPELGEPSAEVASAR
jgi:hypothetical protein